MDPKPICRLSDTSRLILSASLLGVAQRKSGENEEMLNRLGGRIRELREEFGISQAELCRRLQRAGWDCDTLVMSRIERGVRTLTDIEILAILRVLNKSLKDF
ncbi:MAG: helix-turn-helix transcriptional regulator [Verrucomicrobiota bacterium]